MSEAIQSRVRKTIVVLAPGARTTTATSDPIPVPADVTAITFISDQNTVTGTSPTMDVSIEVGPTVSGPWFGIGRMAQQTSASERFYTQNFVGSQSLSQTHSTNWLGGEALEVTPTGGASNAIALTSFPFMRVVATIGGTNPNFNGAVYANMISVR